MGESNRGLGSVQLQTPRKSLLGEEADLRYHEFVKLRRR